MSDPPDVLVDKSGRWTLPIVGGEVTQVRIDYSFSLLIATYAESAMDAVVRINTPFVVRNADTDVTIDPVQTSDLGPLVTLHKAVVAEAYALLDGHLDLRLDDGRAIEVPPHAQYEAWEAQGHRQRGELTFHLVASPSRGVVKVIRVT